MAPQEGSTATIPLVRADGTPDSLVLLVIGERGVRSYPLPRAGRVTLGRDDDCDIVLDDASISRRHAVLSVGPPLVIADAASTNGVRVRGRRLDQHEQVAIGPGETIELGTVLAVVQWSTIDRARDVTLPPPPPSAPGRETEGIVLREPAMKRIYDVVVRVARSDLPVLVLGETGVGKEVVAETIHRASRRANGPLLRLNCGALSASLLESELFGHERGAFTGADRAKEGLFESATGGTVFLDEVGELPLDVQVKLLRVLEDRSVMRVGSVRAREIDVRFVAATNRDLRDACDAGAFRRDLYFRLNGISIEIPPLRERRKEIEPLALAFAERAVAGTELDRAPSFSREALALFERYAWPGNVRELRHVVDRSVLLAGAGPITPAHLPREIAEPAAAPDAIPSVARTDDQAEPQAALGTHLASMERDAILDALERCGGNQTRAAELLGIPRRTLVRRLAEYGVPRPRMRRSKR